MYEEPYWVLYHMLLKRLIESHKVNGRILDLGTGTGRWAIEMALQDMEVIAVDPSEKMLSVASEKAKMNGVNIQFIKAQGEALPFDDCEFDVVLAMGDVISYSVSPERLLSEINRVLKKGGKLLATVDNGFAFLQDFISNIELKNAEEFLKRKKVLIGDSTVSRIHFYTRPFFPEELESLLKGNNFELVDMAGMVVFTPYDEMKLARNLDRVLEWEYRYCRDMRLLGRAEHIFLAAVKG